MTEDIIQQIKSAEEKAAAIKAEAAVQAERIVREAEEKAAQKELSSAEVCKAYVHSQLKNAQVEADNAYAAALAESKKEAEISAKQILKNADAFVCEIVGRITSGDC